jgi:hypothetical protein
MIKQKNIESLLFSHAQTWKDQQPERHPGSLFKAYPAVCKAGHIAAVLLREKDPDRT